MPAGNSRKTGITICARLKPTCAMVVSRSPRSSTHQRCLTWFMDIAPGGGGFLPNATYSSQNGDARPGPRLLMPGWGRAFEAAAGLLPGVQPVAGNYRQPLCHNGFGDTCDNTSGWRETPSKSPAAASKARPHPPAQFRENYVALGF